MVSFPLNPWPWLAPRHGQAFPSPQRREGILELALLSLPEGRGDVDPPSNQRCHNFG